MPKASIDQTNFLGGEWGPYAQGRSDDPHYSTALTTSLNGFPVEEGAWTSRSGTEFIVPTHGGNYANLLPFAGSETCSFAMEFTSPPGAANGTLRFLTQSSLVFTNDAQTVESVSSSIFTLSGNPGWVVGDEVMVVFPDASGSPYPFPQSDELGLRNQICTISTQSVSGGVQLVSLSAFFTGAVTETASTNLVGAQLIRVKKFNTPYTGGPSQIQSLRAVQAEVDSIILCSNVAPQQVQITTQGTLTADPVFSFAALNMVDGPYLDPQSQTLTLSALTGAVTATAGSAVFASTDVGRAMRIFTQPALYNSSSTYTAGQTVTDSTGAWWVAIASVPAGAAPGQAATIGGVATVVWAPAPTAGSWAWGKITAFTNSTHVTFTFDTTIPNMVLQSANGMTAAEWQLGVYSGTTGYPTCGIYYEGRLWLAGCVLNRFDTTTSNGVSQIIGTNIATFSPTDPNGNVLDSSGISEVLNSKGLNQIQWMIGDAQGVLMGTLSGETLVAASALGDPITPTSIQAHEVTRYGSLNIEVARAGMAVIFAQKSGRRVMEYLDDAFSQKFSGRHLNEFAKHLTVSGVARLEYTEEPVPIVWALMNNGLLTGCTYRRFSRFVQTPPECQGWHWNVHGGNRVFTSMCSVPGKNGLLERLFLVTNNPPSNIPNSAAITNYYIEVMNPPFDPSGSILQAWQVDQAAGPGPGNSGYDCGGGNPSGFSTTGAIHGSDTTTAAAPPLLTQFQSISLGQSPPAGGTLLLGVKNKAAFFPGSTILYNLPPWPLSSGRADQTSLSLSVWIGTLDPGVNGQQQGALLSSPELAFSEVGTGITSSILGGAPAFGLNQGISYTGSNNVLAASSVSTLNYPSGGAFVQGAVASTGLQWSHVMISAKSIGDGTITVTMAVNDTVVLNNVNSGTVGNNGSMWPFSSQTDKLKDNGMAVWGIGGAFVQAPLYNITTKQVAGPPQTIIVPPIAELVTASALAALRKIYAGKPFFEGPALVIDPAGFLTFHPNATPQQIYEAEYVGSSYTINTTLTTVTGAGGPSNYPVPTSLGQATGYTGSVAELWIKPGVYIDWTSATNRNKFHEKDTITGSWGPIPLGTDGSTPFSAKPWVYLSGGPGQFVLNNATGQYLTELDTTSGLINFNTGLGGGLTQSPLSFP
jgi:hypothetical protein